MEASSALHIGLLPSAGKWVVGRRDTAGGDGLCCWCRSPFRAA